ncbi:MAG TPA: hypothetical protein VJP41_02095 [Gaiellaceae bacterium]|nr:hypothetical protein [Gaiellaceae bacterium]
MAGVGPAGASKPPEHWLCGPKGSAPLPNSLEGKVPFFAGTGQGRKAPPAPLQSFYRLSYGSSRSCAVDPLTGLAYFIPAAGEIRTVDSLSSDHALWAKLSSKLAVRLRKLVQRVKPYGAPKKLRMVFVKDRTAARPSSYLRLYTLGTPTRSAPSVEGWTGITLLGPPTPWTDGKNVLSVSSRGSYLKRDGELVRIPAPVAQRIRRAESIPA